MTISIKMYMLDVLIIACEAKRFNGLTLKFKSRNEWLGICEIAERRRTKTSLMKWRIHADSRTAVEISRLRSR